MASRIEWTERTWNPVRGCTKISPGCKHCYASTFAERFRGVAGHPYERGFDFRLVQERLFDPLLWNAPLLLEARNTPHPHETAEQADEGVQQDCDGVHSPREGLPDGYSPTLYRMPGVGLTPAQACVSPILGISSLRARSAFVFVSAVRLRMEP